ncbi:penicillin acylase family protein [Methylobacterium sp. W2]|uniref:penicillin acylase family protein n=1 Tax=Methylobacterium sp. W2 TaxID=2598107 RepID=UPI001D0C9DB0|nr:penicillin acylase family protein [Methylobacterium sp. W2]MCC0808125.1 penicillin acylase family protein [Methylobacterium sp. W2]
MAAAIGRENAAFVIDGLAAPAEIRLDQWGVAHIRAESQDDAFLVQGFNAGRDRLWQLDLWRKRGLGLLAADFGPGYLAQDRAARLFLYRGDMEAEWAAYGHPRTITIVSAFVRGLNAFIALTRERDDLLPPEFASLGTRPAVWDAEDVVRIRSHALVRNVASEVARARVLARCGLAPDALRKALSPAHAPVIPEGLAPERLPEDLLTVFRLATAPVSFDPDRLAAHRTEGWAWSEVDAFGTVHRAGRQPVVAPAEAGEGSNNWAVSGARTATGRPILASDPHRAYQLPSLRYVVHLTAPGLDVIGAGEPALPGISIGHNGTAAFSLTIAPIDQEDLFVYETHPDDPGLYRYGTGWEAMARIVERIPVRDGPDEEVTLAFTRHGPVICEDAAGRQAFAVRTVWSEPGTAAYLGSLAYLGASTVTEFREALRDWSAPSTNQVYADTGGTIAWFMAGKAPVRSNWDGLLPVPGDGRYEWAGFHDPFVLPHHVDPECGFVFSANEMNLPADYPAETRKLGFEWLEPWRARRIRSVLEDDAGHTLDASTRLQADVFSEPALRLGRFVAALPPADHAASRAAAHLLLGFDGHLHAGSAAACLIETLWVRHLRPALVTALAPEPADADLFRPGDTETLLDALDHGHPNLDEAARTALVTRALASAWRDCEARFGTDPAGWEWGRFHHGFFRHPFSGIGGAAGRNVGPLPVGGSAASVMHADYRPHDGALTTGASFRMVVDVGDWDASLFVNAPGQSGHADSPHYADHAVPWAAGETVPLLYSREAVDAATETVITLRPSQPIRPSQEVPHT